METERSGASAASARLKRGGTGPRHTSATGPPRPVRSRLALALVAALGACQPGADAPARGIAAGASADPLRRASDTSGLDAGLLAATLAAADSLDRIRALVVARDGEILAQRFWSGYALDEPANVKSASKTVLSALVGRAIAEGVLEGVEQPVAPLFAAEIPAGADPRTGEITVGDLLSMRAGLEPTSGPNYGRWALSANPVRYALSRPFVAEPGGRMLYSTGSSHLLSAALTRQSGRSTLELAREWLGEPLGVTVPPWSQDPQGVYYGGNEMALSPLALLRFGETYRMGGRYGGAQVVPEAWVRASWEPRERGGYGYGWWIKEARGHRVYFAWGYGGQMLFVVPGLGLTVVMLSDPTTRSTEGGHLAGLHALLDDGLIPAAERGVAE